MDFSAIQNVILLIIGLGFLIFVHELGHFLAARAVGIKVEQFAVGMGHAVLSFRKGIGVRIGSTYKAVEARIKEGAKASDFGETEYRLSWMPFGGYVKMLGQDDTDPTAVSDDPRAFNNKPVWARMVVIAAGVTMNMIFAVVFFVVAFLWGVDFPPPIVGDVVPGSPARVTAAENHPDEVGLRPGDRISRINGKAAVDFTDVKVASALSAQGEMIRMEVRRPRMGDQPAQELLFSLEPKATRDGLYQVGIAQPMEIRLFEEKEIKNAPAVYRRVETLLTDLGLSFGMRLVAVNGQPVEEYWQYRVLLNEANGKPVELQFHSTAEGSGEGTTITITPETELEQNGNDVEHLLGLTPPLRIISVQKNSGANGALEAGDLIVEVGVTPWPTFDELRKAAKASAGKPMPIAVRRGDQRLELVVTPNNDGKIGIVPEPEIDTNIVGSVLAGSPFLSMQWMRGTRITQINGQAVENYVDIRGALAEVQPGESVDIRYELPLAGGVSESQSITIESKHLQQMANLRWSDPLALFFADLQVPYKAAGPVEAIEMGVQRTWKFALTTYITIARLFDRRVPVKELRGPVGIIDLGAKASARGWSYLLFFLGLINVALAVFNFLPLPIVDGGLFVLLIVEKIRGKPVPLAVQSAITYIGLVLIGGFFIFVTTQDIVRLISGQ
jgi:regulator of sigma E protease